MNATSIAKLDGLANELESKGLIKEAASLDVVSNTLEREAALEMLKSLASKIPGLSKIQNKQQALSVIWNAVKQIGKDRVIEAIDAVLKVMSQQTPFSAPNPERVAGMLGGLSDLFRRYGALSGLLAAVVFLIVMLGSGKVEALQKQIAQQTQAQVQQIEQTEGYSS